MRWPGKDDEDDDSFHAQPKTKPSWTKYAQYAVGAIAIIYLAGIMFGGPCSRPDDHPDAGACTADTVVDGKKVDGTDGPLDWTKWLQSPNGMHNGFLYAALGFFAIQSAIWMIGYERYYARKLATPEGAWACDPARHVQVLPGGRWALARLGGVDGNRYISADEGVVLFPLVASRAHGRNLIIYGRSMAKERDTLPEIAAYMVEKQGIEGPYREVVAPEDIEPTDTEVMRKVMNDLRDNMIGNHASHRLQTIARTDKIALDHIHHMQRRGFVPSREKSKTVVLNGNGKPVGDDDS